MEKFRSCSTIHLQICHWPKEWNHHQYNQRENQERPFRIGKCRTSILKGSIKRSRGYCPRCVLRSQATTRAHKAISLEAKHCLVLLMRPKSVRYKSLTWIPRTNWRALMSLISRIVEANSMGRDSRWTRDRWVAWCGQSICSNMTARAQYTTIPIPICRARSFCQVMFRLRQMKWLIRQVHN